MSDLDVESELFKINMFHFDEFELYRNADLCLMVTQIVVNLILCWETIVFAHMFFFSVALLGLVSVREFLCFHRKSQHHYEMYKKYSEMYDELMVFRNNNG